MPKFMVLAARKGNLLAYGDNVHGNFQAMGHVESDEIFKASRSIFDNP